MTLQRLVTTRVISLGSINELISKRNLRFYPYKVSEEDIVILKYYLSIDELTIFSLKEDLIIPEQVIDKVKKLATAGGSEILELLVEINNDYYYFIYNLTKRSSITPLKDSPSFFLSSSIPFKKEGYLVEDSGKLVFVSEQDDIYKLALYIKSFKLLDLDEHFTTHGVSLYCDIVRSDINYQSGKVSTWEALGIVWPKGIVKSFIYNNPSETPVQLIPTKNWLQGILKINNLEHEIISVTLNLKGGLHIKLTPDKKNKDKLPSQLQVVLNAQDTVEFIF